MKIKSLILSAVLVLTLATSVSAQSTDNSALIAQLQAQINSLIAQIQVIQSQRSVASSSTPTSTTQQPWCNTFNTNLGYVNSGSPDVGNLHTVLQREGIPFAPDQNNTYGEPTMNAVKQLQSKYGILQTGYFGASTRVAINEVYGCPTAQPQTQTTQPAQTPASTAYIPGCSESNWRSSVSPLTCPSSGTQIRTWTKVGQCEGGSYHPASEGIYCSQPASSSSYTNSATNNSNQFPLCTESNWHSTLYPDTCPSIGSQTKSWTVTGSCLGGVVHPQNEMVYCTPSQSSSYYSSYTSTPACTESNWQSLLNPTTCPSSGYQTETWVRLGQCSGGVSHPSAENVTCDYQASANATAQPVTCTSFTYSGWSTCIAGQKSRTITGMYPSGCVGGTYVVNQSCSSGAQTAQSNPCADSNWQYTITPSSCPSTGQQTKTWTQIGQCTGGVYHSAELITCNYQAPISTCTSFTYSDWTTCSSGNKTRTITSSSPSGCTGGTPDITSTSCTTPVTITSPNGGENWNGGTTQTITWSPTSSGTVKIELRNGSSSYLLINSSAPDSGSYNWTIPALVVSNNNYKIRVTKIDGGYSESNSPFTITAQVIAQSTSSAAINSYYQLNYINANGMSYTLPASNSPRIMPGANPSVSLISPIGGETLTVGQRYNITWSSSDYPSFMGVYLYIVDYSAGYLCMLDRSTLKSLKNGTYAWTVPASMECGDPNGGSSSSTRNISGISYKMGIRDFGLFCPVTESNYLSIVAQ